MAKPEKTKLASVPPAPVASITGDQLAPLVNGLEAESQNQAIAGNFALVGLLSAASKALRALFTELHPPVVNGTEKKGPGADGAPAEQQQA